MSLQTPAREREHEKYARTYALQRYGMGGQRKIDAIQDLRALPCRGSYLDVGCGRGEMLKEARGMGFSKRIGVDVVPQLFRGTDFSNGSVTYGEAYALPFPEKFFDVVTMFDVIEHLLQGDDETACRELERVARRHIIVTANNRDSHNQRGEQLHINQRPYEEWDQRFRQWFSGAVRWIKTDRHYVSETWRIDL